MAKDPFGEREQRSQLFRKEGAVRGKGGGDLYAKTRLYMMQRGDATGRELVLPEKRELRGVRPPNGGRGTLLQTKKGEPCFGGRKGRLVVVGALRYQ